jgi:hypothetical protein
MPKSEIEIVDDEVGEKTEEKTVEIVIDENENKDSAGHIKRQ